MSLGIQYAIQVLRSGITCMPVKVKNVSSVEIFSGAWNALAKQLYA